MGNVIEIGYLWEPIASSRSPDPVGFVCDSEVQGENLDHAA